MRDALQRNSIASQIMRHADQNGDVIAVQHGLSALSYAKLASSAIRIAQYLEQQCRNGQSVSLCVADPMKFLPAFIGARLCRHNVLVLNPAWPSAMQTQCIDHLTPACTLDDKTIEAIVQAEIFELNIDFVHSDCDDTDLNAPFYTGFTSGSEGQPKGFTRHENSWLHSFETDAESYGLSAGDTVVCPGSLAHSLFLYASLRALYAGLRVVFFNGLNQRDQRTELAEIQSAVLFAVPAQLRALVDSPLRYENLRLVISAGAKLQPKLRAALTKTLSSAQIMECYGSSELSYIALSKPVDMPPAESVGKACAGVQIRITDNEYRPVTQGETGRILVKSPLRFIGYAQPDNRNSLNNIQKIDDYLDSGDSGYIDESGFLFVTGRSDRMMSVAGHSVFPEQIETALAAFEKIRQVAIFPVFDELRGQRPIAVVQVCPETNLSRSEIVAFAKAHLPDHAIPRHYYCITNWPSTVSDKTDIQKLQAMYQQQSLEQLR